uniref:Uncharacterized protein n=1 Tax=Aegilops tauschii subsp. strangulata TaxID=200361 RepID=A0A453DE18_AEGTS
RLQRARPRSPAAATARPISELLPHRAARPSGGGRRVRNRSCLARTATTPKISPALKPTDAPNPGRRGLGAAAGSSAVAWPFFSGRVWRR